MNVVIINTTTSGGAAEACLNLIQGLKAIGVNVVLLTVTDAMSGKKNMLQKIAYRWRSRKVVLYRRKLLEAAPVGFDYFSFPYSRFTELHKHPAIQKADIINVHWIANLVDYPSFFRNVIKPVVWTLHDVHAFTGGCHYTYGCEQFKAHCDSCPQVSEVSRPKVAKALADKIKVLTNQHSIVGPSQWITEHSRTSRLFGKYQHRTIPNSIDTDVFTINDSLLFFKEKWRLSPDSFVVSFVATDVQSSRKGFDFMVTLKQALAAYSSIVFVCVGETSTAQKGFHNLGFIRDKHTMAAVYNASDLFIIPSRQDNLPNTMLEALCCGTPVMGWNIGGIPDGVEHGKNGFLAPFGNINAMKTYVEDLYTGKQVLNTRSEIAAAAQQKYALKKQAISYRELFQELCEK